MCYRCKKSYCLYLTGNSSELGGIIRNIHLNREGKMRCRSALRHVVWALHYNHCALRGKTSENISYCRMLQKRSALSTGYKNETNVLHDRRSFRSQLFLGYSKNLSYFAGPSRCILYALMVRVLCHVVLVHTPSYVRCIVLSSAHIWRQLEV